MNQRVNFDVSSIIQNSRENIAKIFGGSTRKKQQNTYLPPALANVKRDKGIHLDIVNADNLPKPLKNYILKIVKDNFDAVLPKYYQWDFDQFKELESQPGWFRSGGSGFVEASKEKTEQSAINYKEKREQEIKGLRDLYGDDIPEFMLPGEEEDDEYPDPKVMVYINFNYKNFDSIVLEFIDEV